MSNDLSLTAVDDLVALLKTAGIRSVSQDPATLNPPAGVWVQVLGFAFTRLAGYTIRTRLVVVATDLDHKRAAAALLKVANQVRTVVDPDGDVLAQTVLMPDGTARPGLAIPCNLYADYDQEETP